MYSVRGHWCVGMVLAMIIDDPTLRWVSAGMMGPDAEVEVRTRAVVYVLTLS